MRNKAPLALMELLIMLLVFSLASGLCLQAFSIAKQQAIHSMELDCAVLQAQNAAELIKYYDGNFSSAAKHMGGTADELSWQIYYDENWNVVSHEDTYCLSAMKQASDSPLLDNAIVSVYDSKDELLFSLPVAWQEVENQ